MKVLLNFKPNGIRPLIQLFNEVIRNIHQLDNEGKNFFCFWRFLLIYSFINNTNTGYISKQNTGHDSTIQYAADLIYNDNHILISLNIFYINNINYSYKCLKMDHFLTNLISLELLFSCKILYLRLLLKLKKTLVLPRLCISLQEGDIVKREAYANLLEKIAEKGVSDLYKGDIAQEIVDTVSIYPGSHILPISVSPQLTTVG